MDINRFVRLLVDSGLMDKGEVQKLARPFKGHLNWWKRIEAKPFSDFLVSTNRLTQWQCDKLLVGKFRGFYLDDYVLLEHVGKDLESSSYKARGVKDGRVVCLVVKPVNKTNGRIDYRVEPFAE